MKLPHEVWSQLGAIPVYAVKVCQGVDGKEDDDAYGLWRAARRDIQVSTVAVPPAQLATLYHEMVHLAIHDAGLSIADEATEERICEALGTYFAAATLAGYIKLQVPK